LTFDRRSGSQKTQTAARIRRAGLFKNHGWGIPHLRVGRLGWWGVYPTVAAPKSVRWYRRNAAR